MQIGQHKNTYNKYKNSGIEWIGDIPQEWTITHVKNYCKSVFSGGTPDTKNPEYWDGDISWLPSGEIQNCIITQPVRYITHKGLENSSTKMIPAETTLIAMTGATCGNIGYLTFNSCANQSVSAYIAKDTTYSKFLYYLLQSAKEEILLAKTGGAQGGINVFNCKNIPVPYLSYADQQNISNYLDKKCGEIDEVVEKEKEVIEKLKEYKQSVITEAVTKGLDKSVPLKDSGVDYLGEIPHHWNIKNLRYLATCQNGISKGSEYFGKGYPFVSYTDVYKNEVLPEKVIGLCATSELEQKIYSVHRNDIFFTRTSETIEEIAITCVCKKTIPNATFAGFLIRVRPYTDELIVDFSKYYFESEIHRKFFVKEMNLVIRASLSQELLKKLPVLLPPSEEQRQIANYLDKKSSQIDNVISEKEQLIEKLTEYKKSLIYECVTGKRKVTSCHCEECQ